MAPGLVSNSESVRKFLPKCSLDDDLTDTFKLLFADTDAKKYPWSGRAIKPFKAFDLEAICKCAASLSTSSAVGVEEFSEGEVYQIEPGMIRPFKAARKLKGHHLFIRRSAARRAHMHSSKIQEGGCYNSLPISHGSYGPYGFEP